MPHDWRVGAAGLEGAGVQSIHIVLIGWDWLNHLIWNCKELVYPKHSMYGIYTYIGVVWVNVGIYGIHGVSGYEGYEEFRFPAVCGPKNW